MGNKVETIRKSWRGTRENWEGNPGNNGTDVIQVFQRSGSDLPKYKSVIKSGANATTPLNVTIQDVFIKLGREEQTWVHKTSQPQRRGKTISDRGVLPSNCVAHTDVPGSLFRASVGNAALIGIIKKIRKHQTGEFSGPTFLGELRETLAMIRNPLASLRLKTGLFTNLHQRVLRDKQAKGRRFKPEPWRKVVSDTWLEYSFGAKPLMQDIAAIIDIYSETRTKLFPVGLQRLSYRHTDSYHDQNNASAYVWLYCKVPYTEWRSYRASSQYVVWLDNDLVFRGQDATERLSALSKFDLSEIIPTAWELMPWSFLIDYWTNIGDVLGSTFDFNQNVAFAKVTSVDSCLRFHNPGVATSLDPSAAAVRLIEPWTYASLYKRIVRNSVPILGFPQFATSLPSLGQAVNMAALFSSLSNSNPFRGHTLK